VKKVEVKKVEPVVPVKAEPPVAVQPAGIARVTIPPAPAEYLVPATDPVPTEQHDGGRAAAHPPGHPRPAVKLDRHRRIPDGRKTRPFGIRPFPAVTPSVAGPPGGLLRPTGSAGNRAPYLAS
jgi:hypothetical protein